MAARTTKPSLSLVATPLYQFDASLGKGGSVSAFLTFFDINSKIPQDDALSIGLNFVVVVSKPFKVAEHCRVMLEGTQ